MRRKKATFSSAESASKNFASPARSNTKAAASSTAMEPITAEMR
jgi:hypothetical protein